MSRDANTFISLFSGIGGFDLGFERAGLKPVAQVEINHNCNDVLAHHFPRVERFRDVRDFGKPNLKADVICGGFPCQDLSVAGHRAGLAGERSGLWFEFHRIVTELKPRWVVVENVPGLLSSNEGRDFAVILRGLVGCGYGIAWRILDAQYFGVAQRRRRVFIVGSLGDGRAAQVLFERESGAWSPPPSREARAKVAATLGAEFARNRGLGQEQEIDTLIPEIASPLTRGTAVGSGVNDPGRRAEDDVNLVAYTLPASARGTGDGHGNAWNSNYVTAPLKAESPSRRNGGSDPIAGEFVISKTPGSHHSRNDPDSMDTYGVNAFTGHTGGADDNDAQAGHMIAPETLGVRRLTPTECERLQGFPDGWTAVNGQSDSARYRQLGNAVCVPVAEWIGRRIAILVRGQ